MRVYKQNNLFKYLAIGSIIFVVTLAISFSPLVSAPFRALGNPLLSIERFFYRFKIATGSFWHYLVENTESEVQALMNENVRLKANLAELELVAKENISLREQLNIQKRHERRVALAHVIGEKPGSFSRFLVLDIGSNQGLRPGLPVVANNALVGKIEKVTEHSAEMSLLTDPNSIYYSYLQSSKTKGLIKGTIGLGMLHLTQVPKNAAIIKGENVFTTGQELENFNDILIGTVTEVISGDQDTYLTLLVKPTIEPQNLDTVFVVIN